MERKREETIETAYKLDEFYAMRKGKLTYPSVCISKEMKEDDTDLPIILDLLPKGELPLIIIYKGKLLEVRKVSKDIRTLTTLIRLYNIEVFLSDEENHTVKTIGDLIQLDFDWR